MVNDEQQQIDCTALFCRLPDSASTTREWNGDDRTDRRWPRQWRDAKVHEERLTIRLTWADGGKKNRHLIGCFLLNMPQLERLGYVEPAAEGLRTLCFIHQENGGIYIAPHPGSDEKLLVGIY